MPKYLLAGEDEKKYRIQGADGDSFEIAKGPLADEVHSRIKALPKAKGYADGGTVEDPTDLANSTQVAENDVIPNSKPQSYSNQAPSQNDTFDARVNAELQKPVIWDPVSHTQVFKGEGRYDQVQGSPEAKKFAEDSVLSQMEIERNKSKYEQMQAAAADKQKQAEDSARASRMQALGITPPQSGSQIASNGPVTGVTPEKLSDSAPQGNPPANAGDTSGLMAAANDPMGFLGSAYKNTAAGIQAKASAESDLAKSQSAAYNQSIVDQQKILADYQKHQSDAMNEQNQLMTEIRNAKIDPGRYMKTAFPDTGSKILAGVGLLLSGIGSGASGQQNMAMAMIQKNIDRDIDAQKTNLGKSQTLLSMNFQKIRDINAAMAETRLQYNSILQAQIQKAAAQSGSPMAAANAKFQLGQLQQQMAPLVQQVAMYRTQAQSMGAGGQEGGFPIGQTPLALSMNKEYRETAVPLTDVGREYQARTSKDAEELKKMEAMYKPIQQDIATIKGMGPSAILDAGQRKQAQAALGRIAMAVNEFNGYNRFTDMDAKTIENMFNNPSSIASLFQGQGATADTLKALQNKLESERTHRLIGYQGKARFNFNPMGTVANAK